MAWRTPITSAVLTCDNFYEPFKDSDGNIIIIELKPREVVHFEFKGCDQLATDSFDWEVLAAIRISEGNTTDAAFTADKTFTATNANNDIQLQTPVGLQTGDGPFRVSNAGGNAALPNGLLINTDYWVIRNDATDIGLATTLANAIAGTAVTFDDDGDGANTFVQGAKGHHIIPLDTAADNQVDNYYNSMFIHLTAADEFRQINDYISSGDIANMVHSFDSSPASGTAYDIWMAARVPDGSGSITAAANIIDGTDLMDEFGASGYQFLIPRARSGGGTDAHLMLMTYAIDGVDA